jgi:hypothetical protein
MNGSPTPGTRGLFELFNYAIRMYDAEMARDKPRNVARLEGYLSREIHKDLSRKKG